jgi:hypothetical protein
MHSAGRWPESDNRERRPGPQAWKDLLPHGIALGNKDAKGGTDKDAEGVGRLGHAIYIYWIPCNTKLSKDIEIFPPLNISDMMPI